MMSQQRRKAGFSDKALSKRPPGNDVSCCDVSGTDRHHNLTMFSKFALGLALIVASAFADEEGEKDDVGVVIGVDLGTT